ncbi:hypothetical protein [Halobacillus campisalis]|uniref:Pilus assembly protein PilO n=1 Tax=Halobacillus campisalis TaxID=435909 RepID=A0ABW2K5M5_9BACI|nr:hypothetical protein [Halobacillus campisalis]
MLRWNKTYTLTLTAVIIGLFGLGFLLHDVFIKGTQEEVQNLRNTISNEQKILEELQKRENASKTSSNLRELLVSLPVTEKTDQLLIALERAESISDSLINSVTTQSAGTDPREATNEEESQNSLPEGVQKLSYEVEVLTDGFSDFLIFLEELSNDDRILTVDAISFDDSVPEGYESDVKSYLVTVSAFFQPDLGELESEQPSQKYDEESNKINPF